MNDLHRHAKFLPQLWKIESLLWTQVQIHGLLHIYKTVKSGFTCNYSFESEVISNSYLILKEGHYTHFN